MPISNFWHLPPVIHFATALKPKRILEVGIGTGTYGFMLRQFLDVASERVAKSDWQVHIEGVELFEPYRNPVWDYAYDNVHMGKIEDLLPALGQFDLIVCTDVIEHFTKEDAHRLIQALASHADVTIYTTPSGHYPQGAWGGNEAETHLSTLRAHDFNNLVAEIPVGVTTCFICSRSPSAVKVISAALETCPRIKQRWFGHLKHRARRAISRLSCPTPPTHREN